jgi:formylglycine-generating enzyme required for sulfatase activity
MRHVLWRITLVFITYLVLVIQCIFDRRRYCGATKEKELLIRTIVHKTFYKEMKMKTNISISFVMVLSALVLLGCPNPVTQPTDMIITLPVIPGVTAPVTGATPVTTVTETTQYTGTVAWSGTPTTFTASTVYTATISLTAKSGYTLNGVAANFFTVEGATSDTNPVNSGVITAVFPATLFTLTMINVPAGRFQRDSGPSNISVITKPYQMSQYEITRVQFSAIMGTDPSLPDYSSGISDPVQMINWFHAIAFCNKLSLAEGLTPVYAVTGVDFSTLTYVDIPTSDNATWNTATATFTNNGYRLPTEMEWMWAAMGAPADGQGGGTNTMGYFKGYAGSSEGGSQTNLGNYAWYTTNSSDKTHPVGTKTANELGLYDMSGNVDEWTWDYWLLPYPEYPEGTLTDYLGPTSGSYRVLHSGRYSGYASFCTIAYRHHSNPEYQCTTNGFRVVRL